MTADVAGHSRGMLAAVMFLPAAALAALWTLTTDGLGLYKLVYRVLSRPNKKAGYGFAFLEGNFAPVGGEVAQRDLEVTQGKLPKELSGLYMRNGPNPYHPPVGGYHWFDGDGMLHAVRIRDGAAAYNNHFVRTERLTQEQRDGWPSCMKLGDLVGLNGVAIIMLDRAIWTLRQWGSRVVPSLGRKRSQTANTALVNHASRILALNEGDLPYHVRVMCDGVVSTIGAHDFGGKLTTRFTAHPKKDPVTGKLHFFSYNFDAAPYVSYGWVDADGKLGASDVAVDLPRPVMMHDFAITERHAIFMDCPLVFEPKRMVEQKTLPFAFMPELGARIGLLPMCAAPGTPVTWFKLDPFIVMHTAAAWEEPSGVVKLYGCYHRSLNLELDSRTVAARGIPEDEQPRLSEFTLDPKTGAASVREVSPVVGDFPTINPNNQGRKTRFVYMATMVTGDRAVKWDGIAKMDLQARPGKDACVGRITLPSETYTGEAVFVPRHEDPSRLRSEDDGFLVAFTHDERSDISSLCVWDARTMASKPLAVVAMPQRVPYGFHGLWVPETEVQKQL